MNFTYGIVKEEYKLNGSTRTAYGIAAYEDAKTDGTAMIVARCGDISDNETTVEKIAELLNRNEVPLKELIATVESMLD